MGERTLRAGGFRLTVQVPDGLTSKLRGVIGRRRRTAPLVPSGGVRSGGQLEIRPVPAVRFERRDPDHALAFVRGRIACRAYSPQGQAEVEDGPEALARLVEGRPWYHTIELPHGIVTQGAYDHRALVPHYGIPSDLRGKRVLDLASADGFWAFEFERRGAEVTALDIETTADVDLPLPVRQRAAELGLSDPITDGFKLSKRALKSGVEHLTGTIYDLDPARLGQFDLVHTGDVLLHLRDPLGALEQIRRVTRGEALLSDVFDPRLTSTPGGEGLPAMYLGGGNAAWWRPGLVTLVQMVADSGFSDVEVVTTYNLVAWGQDEGPWRAVLRAKP
ncbi:MAG: class I SAM-dependent methyltransferase [Acidimicrobiales bacterium]